MVSISDVARMAGVSSATVSRVLSESTYPVKTETRQRVLEAAKSLDFTPNRLARGLVTARTNMIAVIVHDISDPYFGEVVRALEDAARSQGYQLLTSSSDRSPTRELEWLEILMSYRVEGLVFASSVLEDRGYQSELRDRLERFRANGHSVVRFAPHLATIPGVTVDQRKAAATATRCLLDLGHQRIGILAGPRELRASRHRLAGYRKTMAGAGLEVTPDMVEASSFSSAGGAAATIRLLRRRPDITAIFAASDTLAIGALQPLAAAGISVPSQLSLVGFNDVTLARYVSPPLTSVHVPIRQQASEAVDLLIAGLAGREQVSRRLETHLVRRASTGPPRPQQRLPAEALDRLGENHHLDA